MYYTLCVYYNWLRSYNGKSDFQHGDRPSSWILKILISDHVTVIGFTICCSTPNFIKIGRFFTEIRQFNIIFKKAAARHLGFSKSAVFVTCSLSACHSVSQYYYYGESLAAGTQCHSLHQSILGKSVGTSSCWVEYLLTYLLTFDEQTNNWIKTQT